MRDADQNISLAHDVACGETDTEERRKLYRQLYLICREQGRWGDGRIFQTFTGDAESAAERKVFLTNAANYGRVEDALACAAHLGESFSRMGFAKLSEFAAASRPDGDIVARALRVAADPSHEDAAQTLATILIVARRRGLAHAEETALGYAVEAFENRPPTSSAE